MTKKIEQKQETRQRMMDAIHKGFRERGYDGAGVDGLAKAAGVTSGAFYTHFGSKADAFRETVATGVQQFAEGVEQFQQTYGDHWVDAFADFYLGNKRTCELGESCGLQSLTPEVVRSDEATRTLFQTELLKAVEVFAAGLVDNDKAASTNQAWGMMAMLVGGVTLARAVSNPELAANIAEAVKQTLQTGYSIDNLPVGRIK